MKLFTILLDPDRDKAQLGFKAPNGEICWVNAGYSFALHLLTKSQNYGVSYNSADGEGKSTVHMVKPQSAVLQ